MKLIQRVFLVGYGAIVGLFLVCGFALIALALVEMWHGMSSATEASLADRFDSILEAIGLLTIAVAALELGQTILEEEVMREAHMSAPTRVRRFLSRFMIVIVVSLSIECLIAVFQVSHKNPALLPYAGAIGAAAALLLASWGAFVWLNRSVEELEPEAMEAAKREDHNV